MTVTSVKSKVISGLKWNTISVAASRGTDFIVQIILARLLLPDAFGVIGMAMVIIGFLQVISDMGLFNALVQKKEDELSQIRYSSAFWFLLMLAISFAACFFLFISPLSASFYNEPRLIPILNALSFYLFISILNIIPRVILTKHLDFKSLVTTSISGTAAGSIVAIVLAYLGFGVWSLVFKYIITGTVLFFSYWLRVGWRPSAVLDRRLLSQLAGYSTYTQLNEVLYYFRSHVDYLIIGKLVSAHVLGIYTLAFTLSEVLRAQLYSILNKVFFPVYSKIQDDLEKIKEYYLRIMQLTAIVTFPISILCIGLADEIILVVFGAKWMEAAAPLRILSVASMIFAISGTPAEVLKGIGKPNVSVYLNMFNSFFVALPLIYFGLKYFGIVGVSYAVCIQYTTSRLCFHYYMKKYIFVTDREVFAALLKPAVAALVMLGVIYPFTFLATPTFAKLLLASGTGCLAYTLFFIKDLKQGMRLFNMR